MSQKARIAIIYDFDNTLSTTDMQNYELIPNLGIKREDFWQQTGQLAVNTPMDRVLAYMYKILESSRNACQPVRRSDFNALGQSIEFFEGVDKWFERIDEYGKANDAEIEHYIISSGLKEIIEGTSIFKYFKRVYACEFLYDVNGVACWPAMAVNFTGKTQFLYRINKQILEVFEDIEINKYVDMEKRPVPFRNMIYIGDGITDVPCMKLVKVNGGYSIGVHKKRILKSCKKLINENRVDFIFEADYRNNSELDKCVKTIIKQIALKDKLIKQSYFQERKYLNE